MKVSLLISVMLLFCSLTMAQSNQTQTPDTPVLQPPKMLETESTKGSEMQIRTNGKQKMEELAPEDYHLAPMPEEEVEFVEEE